MKSATHVRPIRPKEIDRLIALLRARLPDVIHDGPAPETLERRLSTLIEDGCLIAAVREDAYAGILALDLFDRQVIACYLNPELASAATPRQLFQAIERRALAFGLRTLECCIEAPALSLMWELGYQPDTDHTDSRHPILVRKNLVAHAEPWRREIFALLDELGIGQDYGPRHRLEMIPENEQLVSIGFDIYDREQWMAPEAAQAWTAMQDAANRKGVDLQVVSAFRGLNYQAGIIRAKLEKGQNLERILSVSAAPGFSEHHSGRALDLKTPGEPPLEESFSGTAAYRWLGTNARFFGFRESFGRRNRHGLAWEPWHWCYQPRSGST